MFFLCGQHMGLHLLNEERGTKQVKTDAQTWSKFGPRLCLDDAAVILRQAAGDGFLSAQTQTDQNVHLYRSVGDVLTKNLGKDRITCCYCSTSSKR
jgi:hypothetical protein